MSLLGRLEDLSLPDIVQIVFLSRRTGILEIIDSDGRYTVLFHHGLIVNATSPEVPDLATFLERGGHLDSDKITALRRTEDAGIPIGTAVLEMNLIDRDTLAKIIHQRVSDVVLPLLSNRDGEFNFILSDSIGPLDIEYDPKTIFREGGIAPQKIIGGDGEKLKPLRGLEESMKAGKALLRGGTTATPSSSPPALDLPLGKPKEEEAAEERTADEVDALPFGEITQEDDNIVPFPTREETPLDDTGGGLEDLLGDIDGPSTAPEVAPTLPSEPAPAPVAPKARREAPKEEKPQGRFKIGTATDLKVGERNVLLYERSPLLRVAAKRAFTKRGMKIAQYGSIEDTRRAANELLRQNEFFVTFLELSGTTERSDGESPQLLSAVKKKNHMLPVVVIDREADLRRRARLLELGADHYLTKPSEAHLQPALADEQLALFAEELVQFAERAFEEFELMVSDFEDRGGKRLYDLAQQERVSRTSEVLKYLINELSNPNNIDDLVATILRLASEYVDRAVLLIGRERHFVGVNGIGATGDGGDMKEKAQAIRISYAEPSILSDVAATGEAHRGKIRRTQANAALISGLGRVMPSEVAVLPITNRGHVVGLLYADNGELHQPLGDLSGLEMFLEQAGFALENAVIAAARRGDRNWDVS